MLAAMRRASSRVRRKPPRVGQRTRASNFPAHDEKMLTCKHNNLLARGKTMRRREFIALLGASVAWPFAAMAQEPGRTYRVGGVSGGARNAPPFVAMVDELGRLGFIDGQNLTIEWHIYGPRIDLIPELVAELVKAHVDVIYVAGDHAIRAAQRATATIPILGIADNMAELVNSLARPGGNTTGVSILAAELDGKRQEILIEAAPGIRRMATIADSNAVGSAPRTLFSSGSFRLIANPPVAGRKGWAALAFNFLSGSPRRRHFQARNSPWTMFFTESLATEKHSAVPTRP